MLTPRKRLRAGTSLWRSLLCPKIPYMPLLRDAKTDVVIIGAGITGAMAAEELTRAGFKVILLDRRGPLLGATSATTALLQYEIDQPLTLLQKQIGHDKAMRAWRRSKLALESLSSKVQSLDIPCGMKRVPSLYLAGNVLDADAMKDEWEARNRIGIFTEHLTRNQLKDQYTIRRNAALKSYDNLTVNPLKLAAGFLMRAIHQGAIIHAPVTVDEVEVHARGVSVLTCDGPVIEAKHVLYATGYEIPKTIHKNRHSLHSTWAISTKPQRAQLWPEKCLIWEAADPYLYLRTTNDGRVICGGEDEDFENPDARDALLPHKTRVLEKKLKAMFPQLDARAEYAWCGTFGASKTGLPTIGAIPDQKHCYGIMAFGGNGITYSRIAAELITAELTGHTDPDSDLFAF